MAVVVVFPYLFFAFALFGYGMDKSENGTEKTR